MRSEAVQILSYSRKQDRLLLMKILFFGAGPLGSFYAHLLHEKGVDVTVLARGERYDWIKENGLVLLNEITGQKRYYNSSLSKKPFKYWE